MKRILLFALLAATHLCIYAQDRMVTGLITDNRGVPITGPTVCQANTPNCTVADMNGTFALQLKEEENMSIKVECLGFKPVEIAIDETTVFPLKITLIPMYNAEDMLSDVENNTAAKGIISISSLNIHCIFTDFSRFGPSIGTYNTDLMKFFALAGPEIGVSFSNIYTGLGIGLGYNYNDKYDTLAVDLKTSEYYINFGYSIVSSPSIRLTPMVSLRWLRFRVMNYSDERRISMNQYLDERDLDLRFNQTAAVAGINFDYLMYTDTFGAGDYWSFGAFGGFAMKLNRKPWIYSMGNRIMTDDQIIIKHLTFGVSITLYISASE